MVTRITSILLPNSRSSAEVQTIEGLYRASCWRCYPAVTPELGKVVGATGFEPATPCAQGRCATRLRYAPTLKILNLTADFRSSRVPLSWQKLSPGLSQTNSVSHSSTIPLWSSTSRPRTFARGEAPVLTPHVDDASRRF